MTKLSVKGLTNPPSCGIILSNGYKLLLGHATGQDHWDIPKGKLEVGESPLSAAIRELEEETGIKSSPSQLSLLGEFAYRPKKRLFLFIHPVSVMPPLATLRCNVLPGHRLEFDQFKIALFEELPWLVQPRLRKAISSACSTTIWKATFQGLHTIGPVR